MSSFTLLFVALKLTGFISWPWVLVLLPSIIDFSFVALWMGFWLYRFRTDIGFPSFRTNRGSRRK